LRNIKYSPAVKAIAIFLIWISFAGLLAGGVLMDKYSDIISTANYYETYDFQREFKKTTDMMLENIDTLLLTGNSSGKNRIIRFDLPSVNYKFILINKETGVAITNLDLEGKDIYKAAKELSKNRTQFFLSVDNREYSYSSLGWVISGEYINSIREKFGFEPVNMYAAVTDRLSFGDSFYDIMRQYDQIHELLPVFIVIALLLFIIGAGSFVYLIVAAGETKNGEKKPAIVDWFYNDIFLVADVALIFIITLLAIYISDLFAGLTYKYIIIFIALSLDLLLALCFILSIVRHIKRKSLFRHTLLFNLFKLIGTVIKQCFSAKSFKPVINLMLLAYGGLNAILFAIATHSGNARILILILLLLLNAAALYFSSKGLNSLSGIMAWVKELSKGNLDYVTEMTDISPAFAGFANDIGNLQAGLRKALNEAVKGERLKTELITNVSHDLKTPLTSIINYVDLLKKENLENQTANEYIGILEEKSARLKQLVDDLLEASKAASGDVYVNYSSIELQSLIQQAIAEYGLKAADAGLEFRVKMPENPVSVYGDGSLMWRIMDNLLSNAVKYSQENSRVYIEAEEAGGAGIITIKNISAAPLDIPPEQLAERFVRGDSSRTTEGSGLGLSIAKSLAELQGGSLEIVIDGDLFKAIVKIPTNRKSS